MLSALLMKSARNVESPDPFATGVRDGGVSVGNQIPGQYLPPERGTSKAVAVRLWRRMTGGAPRKCVPLPSILFAQYQLWK